jgi:hypothetical protein
MKRFLSIIAIGAAFLAVALWVWISKGKNAKAVKTKFRLGGVLLTLISTISIGSCGGSPVVTCYDTPNPDSGQTEQEDDSKATESENDKK